MNATERHADLIAEGWTTRVDGLLRPPPDWHDHRVYTAGAAWDEHCKRPDRKR